MLLLEEAQADNCFIAYYDSSNVLMSKYMYNSQHLLVLFSKGNQYVYEKVLPYHYQRFKVAASQGKALKEFIIPNYGSVKGDKVIDSATFSQIKEQINLLKQQK